MEMLAERVGDVRASLQAFSSVYVLWLTVADCNSWRQPVLAAVFALLPSSSDFRSAMALDMALDASHRRAFLRGLPPALRLSGQPSNSGRDQNELTRQAATPTSRCRTSNDASDLHRSARAAATCRMSTLRAPVVAACCALTRAAARKPAGHLTDERIKRPLRRSASSVAPAS